MKPALAVFLFVLPTLASAGRSSPVDDPDVEIARRHFAVGTAFYQRSDYAHALREFQIARTTKPMPELDYNIARCLDRMERYADALDAYQRYMQARGDSADSASVRERIAVLKTRVPKPPVAAAVPTIAAAKSSTLEGTAWKVTSNDHRAATFHFLGKGQLAVQASPAIKNAKGTRRCSWRQAGQELITECGTEGVTWLVSADRMFGQSASNAWSAQRF